MRANSTQHCEYRPHGGLQQRAPETGPTVIPLGMRAVAAEDSKLAATACRRR